MLDAFPKTFLWGATLHSHCVEGEHYDSDWWHWEQRPGHITDDSTSQHGADHWSQFAEDIRLASEYGMNSLLITLEWSRIQPETDTFDKKSLRHYTKVFETCQKHGIRPICALQHVTLPRWMAIDGGWLNAKSAEWFSTYTERVMEAIGGLCDLWIPLHEAMHGLVQGYQLGKWPPQQRSMRMLERAMQGQVVAYAASSAVIKRANPGAEVGWSTRAADYVPLNPYSAWDARVACREEQRSNREMLESLTKSVDAATIDFLGISFFGRRSVSMDWRASGAGFARYGEEKDAHFEYSACPEGFGKALAEFGAYGKKLYVLGNGCPHRSDAEQCGYLLDHVEGVREAMEKGIDVRGYMVHSLLNGFEWERGFEPKYGLMVVDRKRMTRTPNSIALLYKELCETGEVRAGTISKFCPDRAGLMKGTLS